MMNDSTIARYFLSVCLLTVCLSGCEQQSDTRLPSQDLKPDASEYQKISEALFARKLNKVDASATSAKRFTSLEDCGVDFTNNMYRNRTNLLLETGSGVALGDFDGDGLVDIYLTGSDVDNKLFRNLGGMKFENVTDTAKVEGRIQDAVVWASGASFADIDNDGDLDLFVCNMAAPDLLYVNQGDGTFLEQGYARGVAYNGASKQAGFCDYDRDGDLDIYLVTYQDVVDTGELFEEVDGETRVIPGKEEFAALIDGHTINRAGEQDLLYRNDGAGNFEEVARESGIVDFDPGLASIWFDYDDDGWQDIYVTSDFEQPDHLYRNNQDGTFTDVLAQTVSRTPWYSMGLDAGDLNNDGQLDWLVADMANRTHYGQKVNMGNMGDFGWFLLYGQPRQFMKNCLFLNTGTGRALEFAGQAGMAKSDWTWAVRFADLDLDGNQDVFFTNGHARDNMNSDNIIKLKEIVGDDEVSMKERLEFSLKVPIRAETNLAYANRGDLKFEPVGKEWGLDFHGVSHAAGMADLDLDGDLDCVINNYYTPSIVYQNNTSGSGRLLVELRSGTGNRFGIGSKIEIWQGEDYQRRDLIPSRGYQTSDPMQVHFGLKEGQLISKLRVTWPDAKVQEFKDLELGMLYRVIQSDSNSVAPPNPDPAKALFVDQTVESKLNFAHQESEYDDFAEEPLLPFQLSRLGGSIACGDINGDGLVDVYCGGASGQAGSLFVNRDGKTFELLHGPWEEHAASEDMAAVFFDANGDGQLDLYVASGSNEFEAGAESYRDRLYRNLGGESFEDSTNSSLPEYFESSSCVAVADVDHDGDLDLFVGGRSIPRQYPLTPKSYLLLNEQGVFTPAPTKQLGGVDEVGLVNSAIWSDFNGDGWDDLLVAVEWGPVSIFENQEGKLVDVTSSLGIEKYWGWWHGIAAGDLDADGDMDYVVTNQGDNTKYHATAARPHRLYYDDFDQSGSLDLVEAEYEGDIEYPVRGRSCSSRCMPFIAEKYKTFHDYSLATVADIYETKEKPKPFKELRFLESAIIWNDGDEGMRLEPLPSLVQNAPAYGVTISDFDLDSYPDIIMATNFFSSQPETGYMDGALGWMLKGTASGKFEPVWPKESGIVVPGDGNGLANVDFNSDGRMDAVYAVNNDSFRLLKNDSSTAGVTISVSGPEGNRPAIGTKLLFKGKSAQAFEISAGGSYLSQSSSQIIVAQALLEQTDSIEVLWSDGEKAEYSVQKQLDKSKRVLRISYSNSDD